MQGGGDIDISAAFQQAQAYTMEGDSAKLSMLASQHPNLVLLRTEDGETLAHLAAGKGYTKIVSYLHSHAPETLSSCDKYGVTPAHCAACTDQLDVLLLLARSVPGVFNVKDENQMLPLHYASTEKCKYFLQNAMRAERRLASLLPPNITMESTPMRQAYTAMLSKAYTKAMAGGSMAQTNLTFECTSPPPIMPTTPQQPETRSPTSATSKPATISPATDGHLINALTETSNRQGSFQVTHIQSVLDADVATSSTHSSPLPAPTHNIEQLLQGSDSQAGAAQIAQEVPANGSSTSLSFPFRSLPSYSLSSGDSMGSSPQLPSPPVAKKIDETVAPAAPGSGSKLDFTSFDSSTEDAALPMSPMYKASGTDMSMNSLAATKREDVGVQTPPMSKASVENKSVNTDPVQHPAFMPSENNGAWVTIPHTNKGFMQAAHFTNSLPEMSLCDFAGSSNSRKSSPLKSILVSPSNAINHINCLRRVSFSDTTERTIEPDNTKVVDTQKTSPPGGLSPPTPSSQYSKSFPTATRSPEINRVLFPGASPSLRGKVKRGWQHYFTYLSRACAAMAAMVLLAFSIWWQYSPVRARVLSSGGECTEILLAWQPLFCVVAAAVVVSVLQLGGIALGTCISFFTQASKPLTRIPNIKKSPARSLKKYKTANCSPAVMLVWILLTIATAAVLVEASILVSKIFDVQINQMRASLYGLVFVS